MNKLTNGEIKLIPSSYDIIGDIVVFNEFPEELKKKEKEAGDYILNLHKNIRVVAVKIGKYSGRYRLPKLKIVAGEKRKETLHKENSVQVKLDVERCYFSVRLANERLRIAKLVKNEDVLVMFSGVGIYPLVIAKNSKAKEIYGIELNPVAHKYAEENKILNKAWNVKFFKGDVKKVVPKLNKKFDRIVMPLPKTSKNYLDLSKKTLKKNGTIHFYTFLHENDIEKEENKIRKKFRNSKISYVRCGQYAPGAFRVCFDISLFGKKP
mgnify:CR=1 FL=1